MRVSDVLAFIARDPLVFLLLALLLGMACVIMAGLIVTFWRDAEAQAEQRRRQELDRVMQAGRKAAAKPAPKAKKAAKKSGKYA